MGNNGEAQKEEKSKSCIKDNLWWRINWRMMGKGGYDTYAGSE